MTDFDSTYVIVLAAFTAVTILATLAFVLYTLSLIARWAYGALRRRSR